MITYFVTGNRTDLGKTYPVYFCLDTPSGSPEFLVGDHRAARFTKAKATKCVDYLMAEILVDGEVVKDPCRTGSNAVSDIRIEKVLEPALV